MKTYQIQITQVIASSGRYNRIAFNVFDSSGNQLTVIYPSGRGQDDESLAVDSSVFQVAALAFATNPTAKLTAQLYINRCCCCSDTKIMVDGMYSLTMPGAA